MYLLNSPIPFALLDTIPKVNDLSLLVGENGSGKSQLLSRLTTEYLQRGKTVVAIANSIHDKFPNQTKNLHLLRDRGGRQKVKRSVKNALLNIPSEEISRLKIVSKALDIIGYDPVIGIHKILVTEYDISDALAKPENENKFDYEDINSLRSLLAKAKSSRDIIWLSMEEFSFSEINQSSFIELLRYETLLKKLDLIDEIQISLRKNDQPIPLYEASSGELSFISSVIYLSTVLRENSVILIDEPENSLHPRWQKDYFRILLELFYFYQPKIVAATHSALVVTGAEVNNPSTRVFECSNFEFNEKHQEQLNIEEAFVSYFKVLTPENRFLSEHFVQLLNDLAEKNIQLNSVIAEIDRFRSESFDEKQKQVLDGLKPIAIQIANLPNPQTNE